MNATVYATSASFRLGREGGLAMGTEGAMAGKSLRGHRGQLSQGKKTAPTQKPPEP